MTNTKHFYDYEIGKHRNEHRLILIDTHTHAHEAAIRRIRNCAETVIKFLPLTKEEDFDDGGGDIISAASAPSNETA